MKKESITKSSKKKTTTAKAIPQKAKAEPVTLKPKSASLPTVQPPETDTATLPSTRISGPIGVITHYYSHLSVAVVQLVGGSLQIGDIIQIKGHTTDLIQAVNSMELDHKHVDRTEMGQLFGIKVRDHVREHDQVFKISSE